MRAGTRRNVAQCGIYKLRHAVICAPTSAQKYLAKKEKVVLELRLGQDKHLKDVTKIHRTVLASFYWFNHVKLFCRQKSVLSSMKRGKMEGMNLITTSIFETTCFFAQYTWYHYRGKNLAGYGQVAQFTGCHWRGQHHFQHAKVVALENILDSVCHVCLFARNSIVSRISVQSNVSVFQVCSLTTRFHFRFACLLVY